ncbi:MAG: SHOCT domain-containing protein [Desulfobacula sp.]|nr:SHOCT domain-containing protein [Desulfobacula sp.]
MIKNTIKLKFLTIFLFFLFTYNFTFANWPDHGTMYGGDTMMGGGMGWMMVMFWGLVLGILILVLGWVVQLTKKDNRSWRTQTNAMEILKERFAKGEIDITEFESKKKIISD